MVTKPHGPREDLRPIIGQATWWILQGTDDSEIMARLEAHSPPYGVTHRALQRAIAYAHMNAIAFLSAKGKEKDYTAAQRLGRQEDKP